MLNKKNGGQPTTFSLHEVKTLLKALVKTNPTYPLVNIYTCFMCAFDCGHQNVGECLANLLYGWHAICKCEDLWKVFGSNAHICKWGKF